MAKESKRDRLFDLLAPKVSEMAYRCVDVDFEKTGKDWVLTVYIDKPGGISLDDCEAVSRVLSDFLDEADPIEQSYLLEVSSPGLDRPFKRVDDFKSAVGSRVDLRLFAPIDGARELVGLLASADEAGIVLKDDAGAEIPLTYKAIAKATPHIEF